MREPEQVVGTLRLGETDNTPSSARQHVCFIAHLDRWLTASGLDVAA